MTRPAVSNHCLMRWLERVHGLGPAIDAVAGRHASDGDRAAAGCRMLRITPDEARRRILPERLRPLLALGAAGVFGPGYRMPAEDGFLKTVLTRDVDPERQEWRQRNRVRKRDGRRGATRIEVDLDLAS